MRIKFESLVSDGRAYFFADAACPLRRINIVRRLDGLQFRLDDDRAKDYADVQRSQVRAGRVRTQPLLDARRVPLVTVASKNVRLSATRFQNVRLRIIHFIV